jgi:ribosome-associated toxin RatA of RatAB toxin-antitoxin module
MPKIVETRIMNFSAKEIYDLVIDVENYSMQVQGGSIFTSEFGKLERIN